MTNIRYAHIIVDDQEIFGRLTQFVAYPVNFVNAQLRSGDIIN